MHGPYWKEISLGLERTDGLKRERADIFLKIMFAYKGDKRLLARLQDKNIVVAKDLLDLRLTSVGPLLNHFDWLMSVIQLSCIIVIFKG